MHSFVSALIATALAALSCAAPIDLPAPLPGVVSSVEGQITPVTGIVGLRDATPSVAAIFNDISTQVQPYTDELTYLVSSNITVTEVTNIVASIQGPITAAIPKLQALVGLDASIILAPVEGDVELTVSQIATIVGGDLDLILAAAGHVIDVVNADIVADVEDILVSLGNTVTDLVGALIPLVDGLAAPLDPLLAPVDSVISTLGLTKLAALLGLTI